MTSSHSAGHLSGRAGDEASNELDLTGPGTDRHRGAVPAVSARPDTLANDAAIASATASNAASNPSETDVFQPGELGGLRDQGERTPARDSAKTVPTGAPSRSGPEAANVVAVIQWPSGAATGISAQLNIGRDPRFCSFAMEMASDSHVSRQHAVLEVCAEGIRVRDLGSRNGTFVNDERVPSDRAVIVDRDARIRFGPHSVVQLKLLRVGDGEFLFPRDPNRR